MRHTFTQMNLHRSEHECAMTLRIVLQSVKTKAKLGWEIENMSSLRFKCFSIVLECDRKSNFHSCRYSLARSASELQNQKLITARQKQKKKLWENLCWKSFGGLRRERALLSHCLEADNSSIIFPFRRYLSA